MRESKRLPALPPVPTTLPPALTIRAAALALTLSACAEPSLPTTPMPLGEPDVTVAANAPWSFVEASAWGSGDGMGALVQRALPPPPIADYSLQVDLRIDQAAAEDDPVHQTSAFAYYNNNSDLGGYEAALILRQEGEQHYRLMISAHFGEALLWSSRGGILQVRPFPFQAGAVYTLRATVAGARVTLTVNGQTLPLIDYTDRVVPLSRGGAALARLHGTTTLGKAQLWTATASAAPMGMTPHRAKFSMRSWKGMSWAFDGDEPIFALGMPPNYRSAFAPRTHECTGYEVKLVPGYTPQLYLPWYPQNWTNEAFAPTNLTELRVLEEGDRLQFNLRCHDPVDRPDVTSQALVSVSYDGAGNVYRYDTTTTLSIPPGKSISVVTPIDFVDPGLYNGVQSGSPQGKTWPEPHPFSVYQQEAGGIYRQPHNHMWWYPGYGLQEWLAARMDYLKPDSGFWAEVGDPVANPIFQMLGPPPGGAVHAEMCYWAYDMHLSWRPPGPTVGPGDYTIRWRLTSLGGAEGDALLKRAQYALPTDLTATWLLYTGGIGHVERFDKVVLKASPFGEFPWGVGALQDRRVGRGDSTSLRLSGPGYAGSSAGESRFGEAFLPGTDYEVSVWVKTEGVVGQGPGIYFGGKAHYPGIKGTTDWQRIGMVVRPQGDLNVQTFGLHSAGSGTVWFDDFLIRPINANQPADPTSARVLVPITQADRQSPPQTGLTLAWEAASESPDGTLLDRSGWGNHGALVGARWVDEVQGTNRTRVIEVPGGAAYAHLPGYPALDLGAKASISLWVKPGQNLDQVLTLLSGGIEETDLWRVRLLGDGAPWTLNLELPGGVSTSGAVFTDSRWVHLAITHDGSRVIAYLDGKVVAQGPAAGRWLGKGAEGFLRLGSGRWEGSIVEPINARMARLRVYSRVLSAAEVRSIVSAGLFAP